MSGEGLAEWVDCSSVGEIPQSGNAVAAGGGQGVSVGGERHREHQAGVGVKAAWSVPDFIDTDLDCQIG